ncbi:hypothetical protein M569_11496, partial [Genlisea aurea]
VCCLNHGSSDILKLGLGLSCAVATSEMGMNKAQEEINTSADDFHDADWSDLTESELEELVLSNLDAIFRSAIRKIVASGYTEEVASKAILRSGFWYGCKDIVSNLVENTLAFLSSGQECGSSEEHHFQDMQQMEKYILAELVCLLREIRPFFSTGDAMWFLLICDMNISHACAMDGDLFDSFHTDGTSASGSRTDQKASDLQGSEALKNASVSTLKPETSVARNAQLPEECKKFSPSSNDKTFSVGGLSHISGSDDKPVGSRKVSGIAKRDYILRQKSMHFEKHYRGYGSKSSSRGGKLSSFGSLMLDKKLKGVAESGNPRTARGRTLPQENGNLNLLATTGFTASPTFGLETNAAPPLPLPAADTELSLSFPVKCYNAAEAATSGSHHRRDDVNAIMKLVPRFRELQDQLQEWTEWANQKVMQAARRLSKEKAELKTLRQEKEEVEKLKKEKVTLEENTMKKLSEMRNALSKVNDQVKQTNEAVQVLELENSALRRGMEAAKLYAAESAASFLVVSEREKKTLMKIQTWEKQKSISQEELSAQKLKLMQIQQNLKQARSFQAQVEGKLNQEEKTKEELVSQMNAVRKEHQDIESSTRSKEEEIKSAAETKLRKYREDIGRLEREISVLRLTTDSSKIAALKRSSHAADKDASSASPPAPPLNDWEVVAGVKRERECVMCLTEEMSVVFLPCAHQVVCRTCNELHVKQGMKDCPSCRSPIQSRVCVRYAHS